MQQSKRNKSIYGWFVLKMILAAAAFWFIYQRITGKDELYLEELKSAVSTPSLGWQLAVIFLLMFLNWLVEAWKWKFMMAKIEELSIFRSLEAVFSGLSISIFTPNRIGEYAGRVFHLEKADKIQATIITVIENFSQLLVTFVIGCVAMMIFFAEYTPMTKPFLALVILGFTVCSIIVILAYFNVRFLENVFRRLRFPEKWNQTLHVISSYSSGELLKVVIGAFVRYVIFTTQFVWLIRIFGGHFPLSSTILMSAGTFFVIAVVPTFTLTELGIRGAVAAYFFGYLTTDLLPVLIAVFSLWVINLAIPALLGALFMLNFRFVKNKAE